MRDMIVIALLAVATPAGADDVVLRVGQPLGRADLLKPGVQRYLRYIVKDGHRTPIDVWTRTISFARDGGRRTVRVAQQWDGATPGTGAVEDSVMEAGTMRPLTHSRARTRDGKTVKGAYRYDGASVTGVADVSDNSASGFAVTAAEPVYNFVPDIEWFRQLPMAAGRTFVASLYDPGPGKPERYRFTVAGTARIAGSDGRRIDCWLVTTDYNHPERGLTRYWFAKATQLMIRQESDAGARGLLVKVLLPPEAADAP